MLKKLLCAVALLCAYAGAQTINPNQIRPGTQDNDVLVTMTANQPPTWQQVLFCLQDGTNCTALPNNLQMFVPDPLGTQSVVVYASTGTANNDGDAVTCPVSVNATSGTVTIHGGSNTGCQGPPGPTATWSSFTLPSYVVAANVSAIYAVGSVAFTGSAQVLNLGCVDTSSHSTSLMNGGSSGGSDTGVLKPYAAQLTWATGAAIGTISCVANVAANAGGATNPATMNIASIALRVYYTGTAPPASTALNVTSPLYINTALNALGVSAINLAGIGDGGVTGLLPQANLAPPTQTTLNGTTAGTAVWSQPQQFSTWKVAYIYLNGYENTTATAQTITLPAGFATVSAVLTDSGTCTGVTVSGATVTLPASMGAPQTGLCEIRGW